MPKHFENKDALAHVMQKRVEGMVSISEAHGTEMPGYFSAACDATKETAIVLLFLWLLLSWAELQFSSVLITLVAFGAGWIAWKAGRSGWLGWARLERLHRLIEQEKFEIEHHRPQEREELLALYRTKGFSGKLLDDVVDVLMADQDRLLKVMLEEEMGLTLQAYEHPLQQALGACVGALISAALIVFSFFLLPSYGVLLSALLLLAAASASAAVYERNRVISALIWNLSIGALGLGVVYFLLHLFIT